MSQSEHHRWQERRRLRTTAVCRRLNKRNRLPQLAVVRDRIRRDECCHLTNWSSKLNFRSLCERSIGENGHRWRARRHTRKTHSGRDKVSPRFLQMQALQTRQLSTSRRFHSRPHRSPHRLLFVQRTGCSAGGVSFALSVLLDRLPTVSQDSD